MTRFNTSSSALADLSASLNEGGFASDRRRPVQLGRALMTELIDVISDTALEDFQTILGEALIGAFHSAAGRIERDADRARDTMRSLDRDFDGSEAADVELQEATAKARAGDAATQACELIRDAASETWTVATGGGLDGLAGIAARHPSDGGPSLRRNRRSGRSSSGSPGRRIRAVR